MAGDVPSRDAALRQALAEVCRRAGQRGLVHASAGNVSLRFADTVWISPRGAGLESVLPDEMIQVSLDGQKLWGVGEPSSELLMHLALYRALPSVGGVVHTHSPWATGLALLERTLPVVTDEAKALLGEVPVVPYCPPGSEALAVGVAEAAARRGGQGALLLAKHGVVAWASNLEAAYRLADLTEATAHQAYVLAAWQSVLPQ